MGFDQSINDDFTGSGAPALSFKDAMGAAYKGTLTDLVKRQARDMDDNSLKTWDDGSPVWEYVFTLADCQRGAVRTNADGSQQFGKFAPVERDADHGLERRLFAKSGIITALRAALAASGAKDGWQPGGTLTIGYHADGEQRRRGWNAPKIFAATYEPPVKTFEGPSAAGGVDDGEPF